MKTSGKKSSLACGRPIPERVARKLEPELLEKWKQQLKRFLERNKLKFSEQRWKIAQLILGSADHFNAQEMVRIVGQKHPDIGPATVYRNIKVLCDAKILRETLVDSEGRIVFEAFDDGHHDHIVCTDCGHIFEFHNEKIEEQQRNLTEGLGFVETRHRHVIYATCRYKNKE